MVERHSESQFVVGLSRILSTFSFIIFSCRPTSVTMTKTNENSMPSGRSQPPRRAASMNKMKQAGKKSLKAPPSKPSAAKATSARKKSRQDLFSCVHHGFRERHFASVFLTFPCFPFVTQQPHRKPLEGTVLQSTDVAKVLNKQAARSSLHVVCCLLLLCFRQRSLFCFNRHLFLSFLFPPSL